MKNSEFVSQNLEAVESPHQCHWHDGLELQIELENGRRCRIPAQGDKSPVDNDGAAPDVRVERIGTSGWNWRQHRTEFVFIDVRDRTKKALTRFRAGLSEVPPQGLEP